MSLKKTIKYLYFYGLHAGLFRESFYLEIKNALHVYA